MKWMVVVGLALFLMVGMGGGYGYVNAAATPRTIPWDCGDWQAAAAVEDAEDERVSVILESLATNRGKTLYCGVDQSDTFTKAETWEAGRDRNERDDTVYYGENGRFRGFLAAQEGYLTDGESGVTGISRERIFEFPEEERRKRRKRVSYVRTPVAFAGVNTQNTCGTGNGPGPNGGLICSAWGPADSARPIGNAGNSQRDARNRFMGRGAGYSVAGMLNWQDSPGIGPGVRQATVDWEQMAVDAVDAACQAENAGRVESATFGMGHSNDRGSGIHDRGGSLGWFFDDTNRDDPDLLVQYRARQSRTWSGVCVKRVVRRR